jgi:hypothetical protein
MAMAPTPSRRSGAAMVAGAALAGTAFVAAPAFTPVAGLMQATAQLDSAAPALRGGPARNATGNNSLTSLALASSFLAAGAATGGRVIRRAEPISAAAAVAAAAAAAKAAGAAGAAKAAGGAAGAKTAAAAGTKAAGATTAAGAGTGKSIKGQGEGSGASPNFDPSTEVGAMPPLGFFDPAGFCKKGDLDGFRNLRAAEIKHSRVAMMAALGAVVQHYVKIPGFESVPAGMAAVTTAPGTYGFVALVLASGAMELVAWTEDPSKEPGNFGDPAGLGQYTQEFRERELNNGRFAMFAAIGIIAADVYTGKDAIEQFGLA